MSIDLERLVEVCKDFIEANRISCPEATVEDLPMENAPDLINTIAEIVGFYEYPDDGDEDE